MTHCLPDVSAGGGAWAYLASRPAKRGRGLELSLKLSREQRNVRICSRCFSPCNETFSVGGYRQLSGAFV